MASSFLTTCLVMPIRGRIESMDAKLWLSDGTASAWLGDTRAQLQKWSGSEV
jgi:hypothetical protein